MCHDDHPEGQNCLRGGRDADGLGFGETGGQAFSIKPTFRRDVQVFKGQFESLPCTIRIHW